MTTGSKRGAILLGVIMILAAGMSAAQSWQGRADLEVRVSSRKGGNLAGAQVELKYRDGRSALGPPPVATDGRGRAIILGLAAGTWQVEVTHPDFMSFVAVVRLDTREKPQVTASFLEASAASSAPIQVKLLKAKGGPASPPLRVAATPPPPVKREPAPEPAKPSVPEPQPAQPATPQPQPPQPQQTAPPRPDPAPASPDSAASPPTPAPVARAAAPQSATEPAEVEPEVSAPREPEPSQPAPEPTVPEPQVAVPEAPADRAPVMPEPTVEQPEAQEMPAPLPVQPEPQPMPEPTPTEPSPAPPAVEPPTTASTAAEPAVEVPAAEVVPAPMPAPVAEPTAAAAPPAPEPSWRSYRQRTCPECRPGEWAVTVAANLDGAGPCTEDSLDAAALGLRVLGGKAELELAGFAGGVDEASALVQGESGTQIAARLATAREGGCEVLGIALTKGSRFVGFQYEHDSANGREPCLPDQACPGGSATFMGPPRITRGAAATVIHSLAFGDDGLALMTVFFRAPNDQWAPQP